MKKYFKIWTMAAGLSIQSILANRTSALFFTLGKLLRFFFFLGFLIVIHQKVERIVGFNLKQMVLFFLVFNLVDLFGQVFYRGIYWFRNQVVSGEFDFALVQPVNALFRVLTQHTDILDVPLVLITIVMLIINLQGTPLLWLAAFGVAIVSGIIIVTAIHVVAAALGVMTTEVDHTMMIFRDISSMARVPVDIYTDNIRVLLTFVIPVALAFTFPAKAVMGLLNPWTLLASLAAAVGFLWLSLRLWRFALTKYSSASS